MARGLPMFVRAKDSPRGPTTPGVLFLSVLIVEAGLLGLVFGSGAPSFMALLAGPAILLASVLAIATVGSKWGRRTILMVFCTISALPALLFGPHLLVFLACVALNYLVYLSISIWASGMHVYPLLTWAIGESLEQTLRLFGVIARALPLLFAGLIVLFFNSEVWQMAQRLEGAAFWLAVGAMMSVAIAAQVIHMSGVARDYCSKPLTDDGCWSSAEAELQALARKDNALGKLIPLAVPRAERQTVGFAAPLRANVAFLLLFAQTLQLLAICVSLGFFIIGLGALSLPPETQMTYAAISEPGELQSLLVVDFAGSEFVVTMTLMKVSLVLSPLSYLTFVLFSSTQPDYITRFLPHIDARITQAVTVRQFYDCIFWRPRIVKVSKSHFSVEFAIPRGVSAETAQLSWRIVDGPSEFRAMERKRQLLRASVHVKAGATLRYHYVVNGTTLNFDYEVHELQIGDRGEIESVLTMPHSEARRESTRLAQPEEHPDPQQRASGPASSSSAINSHCSRRPSHL